MNPLRSPPSSAILSPTKRSSLRWMRSRLLTTAFGYSIYLATLSTSRMEHLARQVFALFTLSSLVRLDLRES